MFRSMACRRPTLLLACISVAGCSKESDHPRTAESATSAQGTVTDSTLKTDTSASFRASAPGATTTPAEKPDSPAPVKAHPTPKPSVDPGRKTTKPITVPRTTPAPSQDSTPAPAQSDAQGQGLKYDAASNTVTFELVAGPFNFNGFTSGAATLAVPPKANMVINFVNKDGTPHSAEVISGDGPIPNAATDPAIPRAYTNKVLEGLPQEATDAMRFAVPESGTYRIFCGVPGHGLSGMWIWLKVDPAAKAPSFGPTKG
jgi:plastocyanin